MDPKERQAKDSGDQGPRNDQKIPADQKSKKDNKDPKKNRGPKKDNRDQKKTRGPKKDTRDPKKTQGIQKKRHRDQGKDTRNQGPQKEVHKLNSLKLLGLENYIANT